jgi:type III secretory pathway component EscV
VGEREERPRGEQNKTKQTGFFTVSLSLSFLLRSVVYTVLRCNSTSLSKRVTERASERERERERERDQTAQQREKPNDVPLSLSLARASKANDREREREGRERDFLQFVFHRQLGLPLSTSG